MFETTNLSIAAPQNFERDSTDLIFKQCSRDQFSDLCTVDKRARNLVRTILMETLEAPLFKGNVFYKWRLGLTTDLMQHLRKDYERVNLREKAFLLAYDYATHAQFGDILQPDIIINLVQALVEYHKRGSTEVEFNGIKVTTIFCNAKSSAEKFEAYITKEREKEEKEVRENYPLEKLWYNEFEDGGEMMWKLMERNRRNEIQFKEYKSGAFVERVSNLTITILFDPVKFFALGKLDPNSLVSDFPHEVIYIIKDIYCKIISSLLLKSQTPH